MGRRAGRRQRQIESSRYAYLVRSYDQRGLYHDAAGYYFDRKEAEDVRREFEERHPEYEYSIEEFDRSRYLGNFRNVETDRSRRQGARRKGSSTS